VVTIDQPALTFTVTAAVTEPTCFGKSNGSVTLSVANALLPVSYLWNNGSVNKDLTGVSAGTYSVVATDSNGCIATASATVGQPAALNGIIDITSVACRDGNSGAVNLTVSGGVPPYSYLWSNDEISEDIDSLTAGTYVVTITDAHSCNTTVSAAVNEPLSSLGGSIIAQTNVTEYGEGDGSVTVTGSGGNIPYEYMINGGAYQSSGTFSSLYAGVYTVTIRDAGLCTFSISVTITQPSIPLTARIISQQNVLCFGGETGSVTVTGWGGTSPYQYSSDGITFQSSGTFGFLGAGPDTIIIRDAVNDIYRLPVIITEPESMAISVSKTDVLCRGGATGTATALVTGGTGPYSYEWNTTPVQTSATAVNLNEGTYTVSVTDINGCNTTAVIVIIQPNDNLTVSFTQVNPRCAGGRNGSITAIVSGGTGPYSYSWDTNPVQTTTTASALGAGNYSIAIADFNGCTSSGSVTLTDPDPVAVEYSSTPATCPDSNDGTITLDVSGGSPPYSFIWSDNSITQNLTRIKPGTYSVVVTDQNSCATSADIVIDFIGTFACVEIPQVITPNNDGYNDTWILKNIDMYPNAELLVFNRWGKLIFRTKNISANPWDGRVDGKLVPTDSYHYILYLNDGSDPKTGVISVIR